MKKFMKNFLLILALSMFSILSLNINSVFAQDLSTEFVELEYTIDEIRQMSLGEYYSNIFPDTFNEFTPEEQEELFNTPYPSNKTKLVDLGLGTGTSGLWKSSTNRFSYSAVTNMKFSDGSTAKSIHHSSLLYDSSGTTWMIRNDSKSNTNYFYMNGYKDVASGRYRMETIHTVNTPSGYWPSTISGVSYSDWVYSY